MATELATLLPSSAPPAPSPYARALRWLSSTRPRAPFGLSNGALSLLAATALAALLGIAAGAARPAPAAPPPAPTFCAAWPLFRLPTTAVPTGYTVEWDLTRAFAPPFTFAGVSTVTISLAANVACVLVHARDLEVSAALVGEGGAADAQLAVAPDALAFSERLVVGPLPPAPAAGTHTIMLRFTFSGNLSATNIGFYASSYLNGSSAVPLVQTKFEPQFARTAFPCFDEPALKAPFTLSLRGVPEGYEALSNMPAASRAGGAVAFAPTPAMSTYQLTAVGAPMVSVGGVLPPATPVTCWTMDRGAASLRAGCAFAVATAVGVLGYLGDALGAPLALPKLDLVYLPVFPVGAMEQWGCVTFTEAYLAANGASAAGVVAHELAHQWFGDNATAAFWEGLWLQEGAATYWPNVVLPLQLPALAYDAGWRAATSGAMAEDVFNASQPLTAAPPNSSGAAYALFGSITYDKGAAVYAALRRRTEAARAGSFLAGLRALLAARAYGAITPGDLIEALARASGAAALAEEFAPLLYAPGVPLVTAAWSPDPAAGRLALTVSRFSNAAPPAAWVIPLSVQAQAPSAGTEGAAAAAAAALAATGGYGAAALAARTIPYTVGANGWIAFSNGSAAEYYRVAYPAEVLAAFAAALADGSGGGLAPDARAALVDDAFAIAEAGAGCAACNTTATLRWAARWVRADGAPQVAAAVAARIARLFALLVDDVPLGAGAGAAAEAATPGAPRFACTQALLAFARDALGVSGAGVAALNATVAGLNRTAALAEAEAAAVDAASAAGALTRLAVAGARDLAHAWAKANIARLTAWYGYRSTLATLVRALGRGFTSAPLREDFAAFWAARAAATPVADGAWQRAVEAAANNAAFFNSADAAGVCEFLAEQALQVGTPGAAGRSRGGGGGAAAAGGERDSAGEAALV